MKLQQTLLAAATGATLCLASATANAWNLGEVWAADQRNGILHVWKQSDLNRRWKNAQQNTIDLIARSNLNGDTLLPNGVSPGAMHINGFSNHTGLDPDSRAIFAYLNGQMQIWKTNGGTLNPTLVETIDVSTNPGTGSVGNSLHMCGGNPQNTLIGCASIGNGEVTLVSTDMENDVYGVYSGYPILIQDLPIHPDVAAATGTARKTAVEAVLADLDTDGLVHAVCSNFDTSGDLWYITMHDASSGGLKGGVMIVDVSDPVNPGVIDAVYGTKDDGLLGYGCGLLNTPDGKSLITNVGNKNQNDVEGVLRWNFADAYDFSKTGPVDEAYMTQNDSNGDSLPDNADDVNTAYTSQNFDIRAGDAHGAEFAGLGSGFMWQVQRVDDNIQIIPTYGKLRVVNKIRVESSAIPNPQIDVIDRSALGTRMYISTRNAQPRTAINDLTDVRREPGVVVLKTLFGYRGRVLKTDSMDCMDAYEEAGRTQEIGINCTQTTTSADGTDFTVNSSDPHGLKSLSYLSGGF